MPTTSKPKLYNPRHPERTLLYQTVAEHYETLLNPTGLHETRGDSHFDNDLTLVVCIAQTDTKLFNLKWALFHEHCIS